jgi:hypothetical protein
VDPSFRLQLAVYECDQLLFCVDAGFEEGYFERRTPYNIFLV